jgi:hypothetical protein
MARIRCHYLDCVFLDEGYCTAAAVEIDPDAGCMTYSPNTEANEEGDWVEEDELEEWEETEGDEEEEEDLWLDDEDEE